VRARTIKPGFFSNESLCSLPHVVRLLFVGLWCRADRSGRLEDRPTRLRAELFPYEPDLDLDPMLELLQLQELIWRYKINGSSYIQVVQFLKHQRPHPHEVDSVIPPIPWDLTDLQGCRDWVNQCHTKILHVMTCQSGSSGSSGSSGLQDLQDPSSLSAQTADSSLARSLAPVNGTAGKHQNPEAWFKEEFWITGVVWQKIGYGKALDAWKRKVRTRGQAEELIAAAKAQGPGIVEHAHTHNHSVLHPATWINQQRWKDDPNPEPAPPTLWDHKNQAVSDTFDALIARDFNVHKS